MKPLTRKYLDQAHCSTPGCTHANHDGLYLACAACGGKQPVEVIYKDGAVWISCYKCGEHVTAIGVKE